MPHAPGAPDPIEGEMAEVARALQERPDWAAGWFRLGELRERSGDADGAAQAFAQALTLDPGDRLGAGPRLTLLGRAPLSVLPTAYVESLFDSYADSFDASLVDALHYRGAEILAALLPRRRFADALDLGCGTGLTGAALRSRCDRLEGWDVSPGMLRQAAAKGIYDRLERVDLNAPPAPAAMHDLIVASDVFTYIGPLDRVVPWVAASLRPGGLFAFMVEAHDGDGLALGRSRRFRFSRRYLGDVLRASGFHGIGIHGGTMRHERGVPVPSLVVIARV